MNRKPHPFLINLGTTIFIAIVLICIVPAFYNPKAIYRLTENTGFFIVVFLMVPILIWLFIMASWLRYLLTKNILLAALVYAPCVYYVYLSIFHESSVAFIPNYLSQSLQGVVISPFLAVFAGSMLEFWANVFDISGYISVNLLGSGLRKIGSRDRILHPIGLLVKPIIKSFQKLLNLFRS